jgi:hypothetical protein
MYIYTGCFEKSFTMVYRMLLCGCFWNTLHYQWRSHWTLTSPAKTRRVLLYYGSSKHCTWSLNKFIYAFKVVKFFLKHAVRIFVCEVKLSHLAEAMIYCTVSISDDGWWWAWSKRRNENWHGKPKYSEKTYPSANLQISNPTWQVLGWNLGRRGGNPGNNHLSFGTAFHLT